MMSEPTDRESVGSITYECPACRAPLTAPLSDVHRQKACPHCRAIGKVPLPTVGVGPRAGNRGARTIRPGEAVGPEPQPSPADASNAAGDESSGRAKTGPIARSVDNGSEATAPLPGNVREADESVGSKRLLEHAAVFFVCVVIGFGAFQLLGQGERLADFSDVEITRFEGAFDWDTLALERDVDSWTPDSSADIYERIKLITRRVDAANANLDEIRQLETAIAFGNLPPETERAARMRINEFRAELAEDAEYANDAFRSIVEATYTAEDMVESAFAQAIETTEANGSFKTQKIVEDLEFLVAQNARGLNGGSFLDYWGNSMRAEGNTTEQ